VGRFGRPWLPRWNASISVRARTGDTLAFAGGAAAPMWTDLLRNGRPAAVPTGRSPDRWSAPAMQQSRAAVLLLSKGSSHERPAADSSSGLNPAASRLAAVTRLLRQAKQQRRRTGAPVDVEHPPTRRRTLASSLSGVQQIRAAVPIAWRQRAAPRAGGRVLCRHCDRPVRASATARAVVPSPVSRRSRLGDSASDELRDAMVLGTSAFPVAVGQRNGLVEKPQTRAGRLKTEVV
jgi:hypothetical protein